MNLKIFESIGSYRTFRRGISPQKRIGFVPTMGSLHKGHLTLATTARKECDFVLTSIFVNPTQFGPNEDFNRYPRDLAKDISLLKDQVDGIFAPPTEEMYPVSQRIWVNVNHMNHTAEANSRPGFFNGVATVVTKLFNIIQPDIAYFGQKDAIQCIVVRDLIKDLNFPIELKIVPTVREHDGLAMSSRNQYLTPHQRSIAPILYKALDSTRQFIDDSKEKRRDAILNKTYSVLKHDEITVDYVSLTSMDDAKELDQLDRSKDALLSVAIKIGTTRLIDNIILKHKQ